MTDEREILSALIDREPVDAEVLRRVLEVPANRALLVDLVGLRARLLADEDGDVVSFTAPTPLTSARQASTLARAAAILLLGAASAGGGMWIQRYISRDQPPTPSRTVAMDIVTKGGDR